MPPDDFTDHDRDGAAESSSEDESWGSSSWDDTDNDAATGDDAGSWGVADEEGTAPQSPSAETTPEPGPGEQYCGSCGAVIKTNAEICPECGVNTGGGQTTGTEKPKSRMASALIGGIVGFFVGIFVPILGQILGGLVAGYLRGPDTKESTITGALSGVFAAIPGVLLFGFVFILFAEGAAAFGGFVISAVVFFVLFMGIAAGMGAVGGILGAELSDREEPDLDTTA